MNEFQLVSAPFASGVAWLVNVLLELGIRTTHVSPRYPNGFWQRGSESGPGQPEIESMTPEARDFMGWHLPAVFERENRFELESGIEVFWEHRLDFARHSQRPTLVFVRDPRDAIYSLYRRDYSRNLTPLAYLDRADLFPDHFPGMFNLPPADTWAAWHAMWIGLRSVMRIQFVRFEALRAEPVKGVQEVLKFLGTSRSVADIENALERSSFERARTSVEKQERLTGTIRQTARRGRVDEWRETYSPEMLQCFFGPASGIMQQLGYPAIDGAASWPTERDAQLDLVPGDALTPRVAEAHRFWREARFAEAFKELQQCAAAAGMNLLRRLVIASELLAFDWTLKVFGPESALTPVGESARIAFRDFNQRFMRWLPMQHMLLAAIDGFVLAARDSTIRSQPVPVGHEPPVLVEENYSGFNLVRFRGRIHAIAQSVGPIDLQSLSEQDWVARNESDEIISAHDVSGAKLAVDECRRAKRRSKAQPRIESVRLPSANPTSPFVVNFDA